MSDGLITSLLKPNKNNARKDVLFSITHVDAEESKFSSKKSNTL